MEPKMQPFVPVPLPAKLNWEHSTLTLRARILIFLACLASMVCTTAVAQTMSTFTGLNTVQNKINASATPDMTIAVGTLQYCEHANSGYQCWWKSGVNANKPVNFLGSTN